MRILHLSSGGLPDLRVERAAQSAKKKGHTMCFAGSFFKYMHLPAKSFSKFYKLPFNKFANARVPFYWKGLKSELSQILEEYRPDLVHAHNIVAAKLVSEFSVPFVYDDHEYWSKQCEIVAKIWKPNKMYIKWLWTRWEKEVLRTASATITVSDAIAEEHKRLCDHVYVAPNFPSKIETEPLRLTPNNHNLLSSVYVGRDFSRSHKQRGTHRDVEGYLEIFKRDDVGRLTVIGDADLPSSGNVSSLGFLPHQDMMKELTKHHIGLLPRRRHWYHRYSNPNKPYEYAHAGLIALIPPDFINVRQRLKQFCNVFRSPYELEDLLTGYADDLHEVRKLRRQIRKFAQDSLVWEKKCEPQILHAYSKLF